MKLRTYMGAMVGGSIACSAALALVVMNIDPEEAGVVGLALFYVTTMLSLIGWTSVIGLGIRMIMVRDSDIIVGHMGRVVRQGVVCSFVVVGALLLLQFTMLRWWNAVILVALGIVLEGMVYTNSRTTHN